MLIASVYDSILIAATKKSNVFGYLPVDAANGIINDLREYVKSIIDNDLNKVYSVVDNVQGRNIVELSSSGIRKHLQDKGFDNVLEPIGVPIVQSGSLFNIVKAKGAKQSRAKTLNDLYLSIRNINGGLGFFKQQPKSEPSTAVAPTPNPEPIIQTKKEPEKDVTSTTDDVYHSLRSLFKFIILNRKILGIKSVTDYDKKSDNTFFQPMKNGDKVFYNGKPVTILNINTGVHNKTLVQYKNGTKMAVDTNKLHRLQESINEGKYIKSKQIINAISKGVSTDKLNSFEEFMNKVEQLRNKIRNLKPTGDKVLDRWLSTIKENPIMLTNFQKIFDVAPDNPSVVNTLMLFINKLCSTVYSGRFKNGELMDKIVGLREDINPTEFAKVAQDRSKFNQHILKFLSDSIGFYQYLSKLKTAKSKVSENQPTEGPSELKK